MIRRLEQRNTIQPGATGATRCASVALPGAAGPRFSLTPAGRTAPADASPAREAAPRLPAVLEELEVRRQRLDAAIARARSGKELSAGELLALQAQVYAYNEQVELVTRAVDKSVSCAKTVLNTQL